jgi:zinc protease
MVSPLVGDLKVHQYSLNNGLRLLVIEDHSSPTFAYQTWFRVGSRDEVTGHTGLAHLFEHMMFKETTNLKDGQFDKLLEAAGVRGLNAFTSRDYTAYIQELPKDKLELIARLEADRMVNLIVDEKAFKTETEVVQNERRFRNENSPDGTMFQELFELAFTKHPYHWPVIGYQKDLDSMSAQDAVSFYRSYYSPNHATIIIAGDVNPPAAYELVNKYYGQIPAQASPVHTIEEEQAQASARHKILPLNMKTEKLMMGYHIPSIQHEDIPAINLAQSVLSGGKSSRLHKALVDTGIATDVGAYAMDDKDPTLFLIQCELQRGKSAAQAETIILKELARLTQQPLSERELEKARNNISFEFYEGLNSNYEKARFLGAFESLTGSYETGARIIKKSLEISAPELQAAMKRYFEPKNRSVITGVPK